MATLTYQRSEILGTAYAAVAASGGGDQVVASSRGAVLISNGSVAPITVTVVVPGDTEYGQAEPDFTVSVPAGGARLVGPFPDDLADEEGLVSLTYSGVTSLTIAAILI